MSIEDTIEPRGEDADTTLKPYYVLPYKICSEEWADYSFIKDHEEDGILFASTLEKLAIAVATFMSKFIVEWIKPDPNLYTARIDQLPRLQRYRFSGGARPGLDELSHGPGAGCRYPVFGEIRIELRQGDGAWAPEVKAKEAFSIVVPKVQAHLEWGVEQLKQGIAEAEEAARRASLAAKRRELERLKLELGEGSE